VAQRCPCLGWVRYIDLYPGIDLEITGQNGQLVQRLVVKEDAAVADTSPMANTRWQVEGADTLSLENTNQLRLTTALGDFSLPLPQTVDLNGAPLDLSTAPTVNGLEIVSPFSSTSSPPESSVHTVDAADLLYSTFLGGPGPLDSGREIAADAAGHAYVTGLAYPGFPSTPGVFDPTVEGLYTDVFIAQVNPAGTGLVYATFLGGSNFDIGQAVSLDEAGNAFVAGYTSSTDFPTTPGAFDSTLTDETDVFVTKLNPTGTGLLYSTLLGGSSDIDLGLALAVDQAGHAHVSGFTESTDFPTTAEVSAAGYFGGSTDVFAVKVAPGGSSLIYSVLLGGRAVITATAWPSTRQAMRTWLVTPFHRIFPPPPALGIPPRQAVEAFLVKLNSAGETVYSTFLGGSNSDFGME